MLGHHGHRGHHRFHGHGRHGGFHRGFGRGGFGFHRPFFGPIFPLGLVLMIFLFPIALPFLLLWWGIRAVGWLLGGGY